MINKAIAFVALSLLLASCGGGSSPETFTVTGTITVESFSATSMESTGVEALQMHGAGAPEPASPPPQVFTGRVAAAGAGSRAITSVEAADLYELELQNGQHIVLEFEDSAVADLHLYLLDEFGVALDASLDPAEGPVPGYRNLSLLVPEAGRYVVRVFADRGDATYSLRLYSAVSRVHEARRGPRASDEFVAHQFLVRTHAQPPSAPEPPAQRMGLRSLRGGSAPFGLWGVSSAGHAGPALDLLRGWRPPSEDVLRWATPELRDRHETLLIARGLRQQPEVVAVSPNYILRPQKVQPNDPRYSEQWFHGNIDLPEAWEISTGLGDGAEVVVAVVDTGVFREHEDLEGKLLSGYDFFLEEPQPGGDDPGPGGWHGTHVAGIIGAATNNEIGVAGVSWGAKILPVRTLGEDGGRLYDTLQGIRYAAGLPNDSGTVPERPADVINLSLGGGTFVQAQADLYQQIRDLGIFVIAASGNNGGAVGFPAAYDAVFAVGATDAINRRAHYSSFGPELDFVAPGGDMRMDRTGDGYPDGVLSTLVDDASGTPRSAYAFNEGTSMATAVASGVVALAKAIDPDLTPDRFSEMLACGLLTDDIGTAGWDSETGWGQINALKTLQVVSESRDGTIHPTSHLIGALHVRLLNAAGKTVAESTVDRQNCRYPYRFENVPRGDYWIVAGTEKDDDEWATCGPGEVCGAFPTLDNPEPVRVHRDREGLNFSVVIDH